jgi:hypothetical protein
MWEDDNSEGYKWGLWREFDGCIEIINERPRKTLGWKTPKEALDLELLRY